MLPSIGTISHGTLNPEHLIPIFSDELRLLVKNDRDPARRAHARKVLATAAAFNPVASDSGDILVEMHEALDAYALPYTYFGNLEGDGSDFGFWPSIESLEDDAREGDYVVKVAAGDPWPAGLRTKGVSFVMEVTDHGNVSLRRACNGREIWAIV